MGSVRRAMRKLAGLGWYARDAANFAIQARRAGRTERTRWRPQVLDRGQEAGCTRGAYFHQDLLVAQRIHGACPRRHIDVGSRVDGFVAHVASFRPIEVIDIRPMRSTAHNITFLQADMMRHDSALESVCDSLSCLHALEHFGLGRYGDPIDPRGHERGLDCLIRMLEPGGILYLSVPVGPEAVLFNCHRRFYSETIVRLVGRRLTLERLDVVDDSGDLRENVPPEMALTDPTLGCRREGCAIFEFRRPRLATP